jgi:hypothetical protein
LKYGNGGYLAWKYSFLGSKKILHIVECLLNSQPPCGIIRVTAD